MDRGNFQRDITSCMLTEAKHLGFTSRLFQVVTENNQTFFAALRMTTIHEQR